MTGESDQGVSGAGRSEAGHGANMSGGQVRDLVVVLCGHVKDVLGLLKGVHAAVPHVAAPADGAVVDAHPAHHAPARVIHDLEDVGESHDRGLVVGVRPLLKLLLEQLGQGVSRAADDLQRRSVGRAGEVVDHGIEQWLDANVPQTGTRKYRRELGLAVHDQTPDGLLDGARRHVLLQLEELVHDLVVVLGEGLDQAEARQLHLFP